MKPQCELRFLFQAFDPFLSFVIGVPLRLLRPVSMQTEELELLDAPIRTLTLMLLPLLPVFFPILPFWNEWRPQYGNFRQIPVSAEELHVL